MTADDAGTVPEAGSRPIPAVSAPRHRRPTLLSRFSRARWRAWRRSRPFWGGLLLTLAGLELFAIPLSGVLIHGAIKLVIYIGIGGVFGVLIGALLIVSGLMTWFNATHKTFYSIAGIVLGIVSFPASNLGGLFLGMLLAIAGGSIAFAWTPVEDVTEPVTVPSTPDEAVPGRTTVTWTPEEGVPEQSTLVWELDQDAHDQESGGRQETTGGDHEAGRHDAAGERAATAASRGQESGAALA
jgi:uncharacterized protein DUF6114